ncbi:MAG: hypothetical protein V3U39_12400 [Acidimicrobiia bacterium]
MSTANQKSTILQPIMQYGFAGMSAVLLGILVWMVDRSDERFDKVLEMQTATNQVIERNTAAIATLADSLQHP